MIERNEQSVHEPVLIATSGAVNNNVIIDSDSVYITATTNNDAITGILGLNKSGQFIRLINVSISNALVLTHNSVSSTLGNRLYSNTSANISLNSGEVALCSYATINGVTGFYVSKVIKPNGYVLTGTAVCYTDVDLTFGAINTGVPLALNQNMELSGDLSHSTVTNNSRITCTKSGYVIVSVDSEWTNAALLGNQIANLWVRKNGVDIAQTLRRMNFPTGTTLSMSKTLAIPVVANDYIEAVGSVGNTSVRIDGHGPSGGGGAGAGLIVTANLYTLL